MTQRRQRTTAGVTPNRSTSTTVTATPAKISGCRASHPILGDQFGGSLVFPRVFLFALIRGPKTRPMNTAAWAFGGGASAAPRAARRARPRWIRPYCGASGAARRQVPSSRYNRGICPTCCGVRHHPGTRLATSSWAHWQTRGRNPPADNRAGHRGGFSRSRPNRDFAPGPPAASARFNRIQLPMEPAHGMCHRDGLMLRLGPRTIQGTQPHVPVCDLTGPSSGCCQQPNLPSASVRTRAASYARGVLQNRRHSTTRQCAAPHCHAQWSAVQPTPSTQ
jgi:hypothetical protein